MKKHIPLLITLIFTLITTPAMLVFFMTRDVSAENLTDGLNPDGTLYSGSFLYSEDSSSLQDYFCIPLDADVKKEDISVVCDQPGRKVTINLPLSSKDFYYRNSLTGNRKHITGISFSITDSGVRFELAVDTILEASTIYEDGNLYLKLERPMDLYDRVILIDPGHGGDDPGSFAYGFNEKDLMLSVARSIRASEDSTVRFYFTRREDTTLSDSDRLAIARELDPDLILTLHTNADRNTRITRGCRVLYSDPKLAAKAEHLVSELSSGTGIMNLGAAEDHEAGLLKNREYPTLMIRFGYLTNKAEAAALSGEDYQKAAAEVIYQFLTASETEYPQMSLIEGES